MPQAPSADDEAAIERLVAALWDLGLEPGHSVRTIEDASAKLRPTSRWKPRCWNRAGWRAAARADEEIRRGPRRGWTRAFFRAKRVEMQQRHARYQDTPYALEPNCKESPGGLRDLQVILWMARAAGFGDNWRQVAQAGR